MAIVIDLKLDDGSINPSFARVEKVLDRLDDTQKKIMASAQLLATSAKNIANGFSGVANQANRAASATNRVAQATNRVRPPGKFSANAISNPAQAIAQYGPAALAGDGFAQKMVLAANTASNRQRRVQNIVNPPDPFLTALMRSRFVQQGNKMVGMPLGFDAMKLMATGNSAGLASILNGGLAMPGGGMSGMAGMAGGGAMMLGAAGVTLFVASVVHGAKAIKSAIQTNLVLGGSPGQSAAAARVASFTGSNVSSVMGNIGGGGIASAIASSLGVSPVRGFFGETNDARDFLKIVRAVGNMTPDQARRYAVGLGAPELAKVALLSSGTRERLIRSTETGMGMPEMRASAEMDANLEIIGSSISRFTRMISGPWVRAGAAGLDALGRVMDRFGGVTLAFLSPISALLKTFMDFYDAINGGSKNSPIDKNTQAIEDLTKTMKDGIYGGDNRARGARPSGMTGPAFEEARRNRQLRPSPI